jgi:thymidylate synthase
VKRPFYYPMRELGLSYPDMLEWVYANGAELDSRLGPMREIQDFRLEITNPPFCLVGRKGMSDDFAYEELTQIIAGEYDQERLALVIPRAAELITAPTSYGPRVRDQLPIVAQELRNENSRRAVVYVGRYDDLAAMYSDDEATRRAGEMPCTCLWQFNVRDGLLHMSVYMRSWDLVWGLSYDIPSFVGVQLALADDLNVGVGRYVHTAGSGHIYEKHYGLETWRRADELNIDHLLGGTISATQENARALLREDLGSRKG